MKLSHARSITSRSAAVLIWGALAVWVVGCSAAPSPAAAVSAAEATLAGAGRIVLICYGTPVCAAVAPKAKIKSAYDAAYASVTAAQAVADAGGTPNMTATTAAMSVLQNLIAQLPPTAATPAT